MNVLPLTFAFLGLFNYGSQEEALKACQNWARSGKQFEYQTKVEKMVYTGTRTYYGPNVGYISDTRIVLETVTFTAHERGCTYEESTRQYLGKVNTHISRLPHNADNEAIKEAHSNPTQVRRHFRF